MLKKLFAVSTVVASLLFCCRSDVWAVDLSYAGSTTLQMGFMYEAATMYKRLYGKTISVMGGSSSAGVRGVVMETISLGGASRPLKEKEIKLGVIAHTVAWDAIAVIVNKNNPVTDLSSQTLKDIFTGDIRSWKEAGGPDMPIVVITSHEGSATKEVVNEIVMGKQPWSPEAVLVNSTRDEVGKVVDNPWGIGAVSVSFADQDKIKVVSVDSVMPREDSVKKGKYKIARPLNLLTLGPAQGEAKNFIDFMLGPKGRVIVAKKFIPAS